MQRTDKRRKYAEPATDSEAFYSDEDDGSKKRRKTTAEKKVELEEKKAAVVRNPALKTIKHKLDKSKMHRVIVWLRNDLRLHDNPVLQWAIKQPAVAYKEIVPVFCFDPRFFTKAVPKYAMSRKAGIHRTRFMIESVADFRQSLQGVGSGLLVAQGRPEDFIPQLVSGDRETTVVYQAETCSEERAVVEKLMRALRERCPSVEEIRVGN